MLESERMKLKKAAEAGDFMSIAVNEDGAPVGGCDVPWEKTSTAFNMKLPQVTISAEDLKDSAVMADLKKCRLIGLYCFTPLADYEFIAEFPTLWDLFICYGDAVRSLSFIRNLTELFMIYLENAILDDLRPLIDCFSERQREPRFKPGVCMAFYHCRVADTSALQDADFITSELLVWPVEGDRRERWRMHGHMRPHTFRFYEPEKPMP